MNGKPGAGWQRTVLILFMGMLLSACASKPLVPWSTSLEPVPEDRADWKDDRGTFRSMFCAANLDHGATLPDARPCEEALTRVLPEPAARPVSLSLTPRESDILYLFVPGLGWECVEAFLDIDSEAAKEFQVYGFDLRLVPVDGLSGSVHNAGQIRDMLRNLPEEDQDRPIVLIGYSKGIDDILELISEYPEDTENVISLVSYAGSVWGTPLVEGVEQSMINLMQYTPDSQCDEGDFRSGQSLSVGVRERWFEYYALPERMENFSVVAFPEPERISRVLGSSWSKLGRLRDARNDSQIVFYDQILPGSTVLAFANADHWAMAVPVKRSKGGLIAAAADQNDYPREIMMETLLRYLDIHLTD